MKGVPVTIILINWNSGNKTKDCIESLFQSSYKKFNIIVVDNGSTDQSIEDLEQSYNQSNKIEFIKYFKNTGFCYANNRAMEKALSNNSEYIILLNNDMSVASDWLEKLIMTAEKNDNAVVFGSKIKFKNMPDLLNSTGIHMNISGYCWDRDFGEYDKNVNRETSSILAVSGGSMMIRSSILKDSGLLDEDYFAYYEDLEFCLRVRRKKLGEIIYVNDSICYHEYSGSSSKMPVFRYYLAVNNFWLNLSKVFSLKMLMRHAPRIVLRRIRNEVFMKIKKREWEYLLIEIKGIVKFPFMILKNLKNISEKGFADTYRHLLQPANIMPGANIGNIEKESGKKWKYS